MFGIEVESSNRQTTVACESASKSFAERPIFGYKYFQSIDGPIDADYPTITWADFKVAQLWLGSKRKIYFGSSSEDDIAEFKLIIDALRSLPVLEVTQTTRMRDSMILRYDKCRRLW